MLLSEYISNVLGLLNDPSSQFYSSSNLTTWVNRARSEVAKRSFCIRRLTPSSGSVISYTVNSAGSGYSSATATVTGPDAISGTYIPATASVTLSGGSVSAVNVVVAGSGYVLPPTVTITGNGTGATATANLSPHWTTQTGQEVYKLSDATAILQATLSDGAGIQAVIGVLDIVVSWGSMKPALRNCSWSVFQAYARAINQGQDYPMLWSQYQLGETGSVYLWPMPSAVYEMQWDCFCTPTALSNTQTVDVIPDVWTNAVFYYACYLAYLNAQRKDDSNDMFQRYERSLMEAASYVQPPRTPDYYYGDD